MAEPLVIVGVGGFGRGIYDLVQEINAEARAPVWETVGFLADGAVPMALIEKRGAQYLGELARLSRYRGMYCAIGIGDPAGRSQVSKAVHAAGLKPATLIHPTAAIGSSVTIGDGTVVSSHVSMTADIAIGRFCLVHMNATVGHDTTLGDFATVLPGAIVSGRVHIAEGVALGANCVVIPDRRIGRYAVVGAGAAVVHDVPAKTTVVGVPAKPITREA